MNTFHVNPGAGDDAANGLTPETAWRTLARASQPGEIPPGAALLLRAGEHAGPLVLDRSVYSNDRLHVGVYGGDRAAVRVHDSGGIAVLTPGALTLERLTALGDMAAQTAAEKGIEVADPTGGRAKGWRLLDLEAEGFTYAGLYLRDGARNVEVVGGRFRRNGCGIVCDGLDGLRLSGFEASDNDTSRPHLSVYASVGVLVQGCRDVRVEHFRASRNGRSVPINCGIWVNRARQVVVRYGSAEGNRSSHAEHTWDGQGVLVSVGQPDSCEDVEIHDVRTRGNMVGLEIYADVAGGYTRRCVVHDCVSEDDVTGLMVAGSQDAWAEDVEFLRNTVLAPEYKAVDVAAGVRRVRFAHNDFRVATNGTFLEAANGITDVDFAGNRWESAGTACWKVRSAVYMSLAQFRAAHADVERYTQGQYIGGQLVGVEVPALA